MILFIVGSDQVWNYKFGLGREKEFLLFADYNKTISYAPSFGINKVEYGYKDKITKELNNIKYISVRESEGAEMIKKLINRDAEVVLDPTLLLDIDEWNKIKRKPKVFNHKKYILTYFLGNQKDEIRNEIKNMATKNNLEIMNLNDSKNQEFSLYGIEEFLYLFANSELVLTDSFHACIFSIIFNKSFFVFDREGKNNRSSRINTLLEMLKLQNRKVISLNNIENLFECNYENSYEILKVKKQKSSEFLKKSLGLN